MKIEATFRNRTAKLGMGEPVIVEAPERDFETLFRRFLYDYGQVVDVEKIDKNVKRYVLVARMQYTDTRDSYELETTLTITRDAVDKSACVSV